MSEVKKTRTVGLFVTCLVDLIRPSVGFAAIDLLEKAGCMVEVPELQTCCGQPAYNSGDVKGTREIAEQVIKAFLDYEYVVVPSGSCGAMLSHHYVKLFENDPEMSDKAATFGRKTYELISFLTDVCGVDKVDVSWASTATYHDSCSGLRELKIKGQPRKLLGSVEGLTLTPMEDEEVCCGFGGTFCVKYSEISNAIVDKKVECIKNSKADMLLAGDLGCLLNMAGKLSREGVAMEVRHVAEVLAGQKETPPILMDQNSDK